MRSGAVSHMRYVPLVKLAIAALLLTLVLRPAEWGVLRQSLAGLRLGLLGLGILSFLLIAVVEVWRLRTALAGFALGWVELLRLHLVGTFFGSCLPGRFGADLYQTRYLSSRAGGFERPLSLIVLMRAVGLLILAVAALVSIAMHDRELDVWLGSQVSPRSPSPLFFVVLGLTALLAIGIGARSGIRSAVRSRLRAFRRELLNSLRALSGARLAVLVLLSILQLALRASVIGSLVAAVGFSVDSAEAVLVTALGTLLTLVPISFSGIGLREAAVTALLHYLEIPYEDAVVVALLGRGLMILVAGLGGLWLITEMLTRHSRSLSEEET